MPHMCRPRQGKRVDLPQLPQSEAGGCRQGADPSSAREQARGLYVAGGRRPDQNSAREQARGLYVARGCRQVADHGSAAEQTRGPYTFRGLYLAGGNPSVGKRARRLDVWQLQTPSPRRQAVLPPMRCPKGRGQRRRLLRPTGSRRAGKLEVSELCGPRLGEPTVLPSLWHKKARCCRCGAALTSGGARTYDFEAHTLPRGAKLSLR
mmetsp:Transcript_117690/g.332974  ORF Transcript_117690/g.332974 Transcript_117690/m.332974 type:complete len:207 (+) Transcript_117690:1106-1726(+)